MFISVFLVVAQMFGSNSCCKAHVLFHFVCVFSRWAVAVGVLLSFLFRYSMFLSDLKLGHFFFLYFCLFLAQFFSIVIFVPQGIIFIWSIKWLCRLSVRNGDLSSFCADQHRIKVRYCCYEWCFAFCCVLPHQLEPHLSHTHTRRPIIGQNNCIRR